ncbi:ATP synthase subunit AtpR [Marinobacter halodurans]|uniref:ATP synthase subunit AtpR n=1 Tax=Marinobacter halodurans TaxID=2528979 RepID=A0ABY1ZJV3_9GAMM|nr:ATP synthase subunit I [Marinobacter halodurans]TBW55486.1 ATP synthase subunit AtpR [Marinobacter halodurans]
MTMDWTSFGVGLAVGVVASVLYFAGLAWSVRAVLRSSRPAPLLLASAALRIALLLAVGFMATDGLHDPGALAGFGLAFLVTRLVAVRLARPPATSGGEDVPCS